MLQPSFPGRLYPVVSHQVDFCSLEMQPLGCEHPAALSWRRNFNFCGGEISEQPGSRACVSCSMPPDGIRGRVTHKAGGSVPEGSAGRHGPGVDASKEMSTSGGSGDMWKGAGPKHSLEQMLSLESGVVKVERAL